MKGIISKAIGSIDQAFVSPEMQIVKQGGMPHIELETKGIVFHQIGGFQFIESIFIGSMIVVEIINDRFKSIDIFEFFQTKVDEKIGILCFEPGITHEKAKKQYKKSKKGKILTDHKERLNHVYWI